MRSWPARPDEGHALLVLVLAGALADHHEPRPRIARAERRCSCGSCRACRAGSPAAPRSCARERLGRDRRNGAASRSATLAQPEIAMVAERVGQVAQGQSASGRPAGRSSRSAGGAAGAGGDRRRAARARGRGWRRPRRAWASAAARPRRPSGRAAAPRCPRRRSRCRCRLTSLATSRSMPLARELGARVAPRTSLVSAAKPTTNARPLRAASSLRMSGLGVSSSVSPSSLLDLIFGRARLPDAVVGHRGRLDHDGGAVEVLQRRLAHLLRGLHRHVDGARRAASSAVGPEIRIDLGAAAQRGGRERVAHLARRAIRDVAHGIDRLARRPRGHQHALAGQVARAGSGARSQRLDDGVDLRQPAPAR